MLPYHIGRRYQRAEGLGGIGTIFSGLVKSLIPMTETISKNDTKNVIKELMLDTSKELGKTVMKKATKKIGQLVDKKLNNKKKSSKKKTPLKEKKELLTKLATTYNLLDT